MNVLIVDVQLVKIFITRTLQKIMNTVRCVDRKLNSEKTRDVEVEKDETNTFIAFQRYRRT